MNRKTKALQSIDTIIIRVSDIQKSKRWYVDNLDLSPVYEDNNINLLVLDTGGQVSLTLWQTDEKIEVNKNTASYPIFRTENAASANEELKSKGINVSDVIDDGAVKYFTFFDPDGNVLEACQVHE